MLSQANVLFGARGELAGAKGLPVVIDGHVGHRRVDGGLEVRTALGRRAGAYVDRHLHGAGIRDHHAGVDLNEITDGNGTVEANAARVRGDGLLAGPLHGARGAGLIDPFHGRAAVDLAAPVDVRGLGEEAVNHARGIRGPVVGLRVHLCLDGLAQLDAGLRGGLDAQLVIRLGYERGHWGRLARRRVLGHEDDEAIACAGEEAVARVGGEHLVDDVHGGAARHSNARADLHDVTRGNGAREVDVADVGGHAVRAGPLRGAGVRGLIDPFEDAAAADALGARDKQVRGRGHKAQREGRGRSFSVSHVTTLRFVDHIRRQRV